MLGMRLKIDQLKGLWSGRTVVCIASGPSLTEQDCELVRQSGLPTIVTNNTFERCPWADVLYAFDGAWWHAYRAQVDKTFRGIRVTSWMSGGSYGALSVHGKGWFSNFGNSGTNAISLAIAGKAKRIILLGYDAKKADGKSHWHGEHPKPLSNCNSIARWPSQFKALASYAKRQGIEIINCSRETALDCFPLGEICQVLESEVGGG